MIHIPQAFLWSKREKKRGWQTYSNGQKEATTQAGVHTRATEALIELLLRLFFIKGAAQYQCITDKPIFVITVNKDYNMGTTLCFILSSHCSFSLHFRQVFLAASSLFKSTVTHCPLRAPGWRELTSRVCGDYVSCAFACTRILCIFIWMWICENVWQCAFQSRFAYVGACDIHALQSPSMAVLIHFRWGLQAWEKTAPLCVPLCLTCTLNPLAGQMDHLWSPVLTSIQPGSKGWLTAKMPWLMLAGTTFTLFWYEWYNMKDMLSNITTICYFLSRRSTTRATCQLNCQSIPHALPLLPSLVSDRHRTWGAVTGHVLGTERRQRSIFPTCCCSIFHAPCRSFFGKRCRVQSVLTLGDDIEICFTNATDMLLRLCQP